MNIEEMLENLLKELEEGEEVSFALVVFTGVHSTSKVAAVLHNVTPAVLLSLAAEFELVGKNQLMNEIQNQAQQAAAQKIIVPQPNIKM